MPQIESEEIKLVDVRLKIPKTYRDKLNQLSAIRLKTVNQFLSDMIKQEIDAAWELKALEQQRERFSLRGKAKGGEPIPKEAIDDAIREFNKIGKQE